MLKKRLYGFLLFFDLAKNLKKLGERYMNDKKIGEKIKEGVSVQELESLARKYTTEVFLILAIFVASISSIFNFFTGAGWSIAFAGLGAIISLSIPGSIMNF